MSKKKRRRKHKPAVRPGGEEGDWRCMVCETPMTVEHGYGGTDMCGPCCTGDSSLLGEFGETWLEPEDLHRPEEEGDDQCL